MKSHEEVMDEIKIIKKSIGFLWQVLAFLGTIVPMTYGVYIFFTKHMK